MPVPRTCSSLLSWRPRRGLVFLVAATLLVGVGTAGAAENHVITANSVAGAPLDAKQRDYTRLLGRLHFTTKFANGLTRLEYKKGAIHVFISRATGRGVGLLTSADEYRTASGVGPCSPLTKLHAAYGSRLRPVKDKTTQRVFAYKVGTITFVATGPAVGSVLVTNGRVPLRTAVNGASCGAGEED
jgi:hypothetical protein